MKITFILITILILMMVLMLAMQLVQKKNISYLEKWFQFECGFSLMTPSHVPFSFQFFLIAILFLIFDIEIALILSYPLEISTLKNSLILWIFLFILTLGLIYEWQKSKINWTQ